MTPRRPLLAAAGGACAGIVWLGLLLAATGSPERDPFDSALFWPGWLVLPAVAFVVGALGTRIRRALLSGLLVVGPFVAYVVTFGLVLHDPAHGASFAVVGIAMLLVLAGWSTLWGLAGWTVARRGQPSPASARRRADSA